LDSFDIPPPVPYDGPIHDIDGTLLPMSPEAEDFIATAKVLAEPYEEDIAALRAEVAELRAQRAAVLDLAERLRHKMRSANLVDAVFQEHDEWIAGQITTALVAS
jgi:hypothetical protein